MQYNDFSGEFRSTTKQEQKFARKLTRETMRLFIWIILWILYMPFFLIKKITLSIEDMISSLEEEGKEFKDELFQEYTKKEIFFGTLETIIGIISLFVLISAIILIR